MNKKVYLKEVLEVKHGFAFKTENYVAKSEYAMVTLANISSSNNFQINWDKMTYYGAPFPEQFVLNTGDLIMPLTEQVVGLFGNTAFVPYYKGVKFILNQRVGKVVPIEGKSDKYYLHYLLATNLVKNQLENRATGTRQRNLSPENIYDIQVFLPNLETQKKIGKTLHVIEEKININNEINNNLQEQMITLYENMMCKAISGKISGEHTYAKELCMIETGKEDANFADTNGLYKFFTCSKIPSKCNKYAFNSSSILIAGNGDFNVKHYSGKFNAYQRTYVLTPSKEYFGILYLASLYQISSFKFSSAGSIVKFITKNDIANIPIFIPDNTNYLKQFNNILMLQEKLSLENEQLCNLRTWMLPLLMNGQAIISD